MKKKTGENITNRSSVISLIQMLFRIWFNNGRLYPEYPEYFSFFLFLMEMLLNLMVPHDEKRERDEKKESTYTCPSSLVPFTSNQGSSHTSWP